MAGDAHGLNTLEYQPAKIAAMEGDFESEPGTPLILFGIPDMAKARTGYAIEIPHLGSLILKHEWNGTIKGLKEFPPAERPNSTLLFFTFRAMVAFGFAMLGLGLWSLYLRWRAKLYDTPWMHRAALLMGPSGFIAVLAGWITTEAGRQPYTVYGLLKTADSVSPIAAAGVGASLLAFVVIYFTLFSAGRLLYPAAHEQAAGHRRTRNGEGRAGPCRRPHAGPCPRTRGDWSREPRSSLYLGRAHCLCRVGLCRARWLRISVSAFCFLFRTARPAATR